MNLQVGDQVTVTITTADDLGYIVNIDNHNVEGFLPLSESHRRLADAKLNPLTVGSQHTAYIIRMHDKNGMSFFDLSKKRPGQQSRARIVLEVNKQ